MFKDTKDGQTHSFNDGCGDPEHNFPARTKRPVNNTNEPKVVVKTNTTPRKKMIGTIELGKHYDDEPADAKLIKVAK